MADESRKPMMDRAAALLAGPFLLGQRALGYLVSSARDEAGVTPQPSPRITVTSPEHAIKRRG